MVIVAIAGLLPVLVALNEGIDPEPLPARPIDVFEFVQLTDPPPDACKRIEGTVSEAGGFVAHTGGSTSLNRAINIALLQNRVEDP